MGERKYRLSLFWTYIKLGVLFVFITIGLFSLALVICSQFLPDNIKIIGAKRDFLSVMGGMTFVFTVVVVDIFIKIHTIILHDNGDLEIISFFHHRCIKVTEIKSITTALLDRKCAVMRYRGGKDCLPYSIKKFDEFLTNVKAMNPLIKTK